MKFSNVSLLVKDFVTCFKFYSELPGLESAWGDEESGYASFKVADGMEGFVLSVYDWGMRMFGFGTITVTTGGAASSYPYIVNPLNFKKEINNLIG